MKYGGMCIGGPAAGQMIVNQSPRLRVEATRLEPLTAKPRAEPMTREILTTEYHHHDIAGVGFWVLEGQTIGDALNTIAVCYSNVVTK